MKKYIEQYKNDTGNHIFEENRVVCFANDYIEWLENRLDLSENKLLIDLVSIQEEYIDLLGNEIKSLIYVAYPRGWKSKSVGKGRELRDKIDKIKALDDFNMLTKNYNHTEKKSSRPKQKPSPGKDYGMQV